MPIQRQKHIIITGAAGYIGGMVADRLLELEPETVITGIDILPSPERFKGNARVRWVRHDLALSGWEEKALAAGPADAVIHCAFRIRAPFGRVKTYERNNLTASENTFKFALGRNVPSLVYLSTVSSYGARKENIGQLLTEADPFLEMKNPYGYQKKLIEEDLIKLLRDGNPRTTVTVLRLNSVTGPRSQSLSSKFGLITFLKKLLPFVIELNPRWARQFVHEDDVVDAIFASLARRGGALRIYNIAPKQFLEVEDIARILQKKTVHVPVWLVKTALFVLYPVSFGKLVPASAAAGLAYPINVDGSLIEKELDFKYRYTAEEALLGRVGRYARR
jgi:nucleoside-diphosphate-sugar epimerase